MSDWGAQSSSLVKRAQAGEAVAMRLLGERFIVGREAPYDPARGGGLVRLAAEKGDIEAQALMSVLAAVGVGQPPDWKAALGYLRAAAESGHVLAVGQLAALGAAIDSPERLLDVSPARHVMQSPRVATLERFLAPALCDWLIERAKPALARARVRDPSDGAARSLSLRTNSGMGFSFLETDFVLQLVHARIAQALQLPLLNQEPSNILHYAEGELYRAHFDFFHPDEPRFRDQIRATGQRVATFLIYLNDDYDGGETEFVRAKWSFKGKRGDALMFFNVTPDRAPDAMTLHAGLAPRRGEKWLLSKWVRDRALRLT